MADKIKQRTYPSQIVRDGGGNIVDFQITNGESTPQDISSGYEPKAEIVDKGFYICPLESGDIVVQLLGQEDGETFTIPTARVDVYVGSWMEEKIKRIISAGTTVTSCLIGWSY